MTRCNFPMGNGKRCKAHRIKGKRNCIFHSVNEVKYKGYGYSTFRAGRPRR